MRVFRHDVFADDSGIGNRIFDILRNVVVAQKINFEREILRFGAKFAETVVKFDAAFFEQIGRIFAQAS